MTPPLRWGCEMKHKTIRVGRIWFRDPALLCGGLYLLLYFEASGFLRLGLWAAFLHEIGHILVYLLQKKKFPVIEVTLTGFCMRTGEALTAGQRFWLAAAGPGANFVLAALCGLQLAQRATLKGSAFWAANLLTGVFNLLPIPPLDGAQMLESVRILLCAKHSSRK